MRQQLSLQKQRRHMKVASRGQILKVEILKTQLGDGAGIREDMALSAVGQNERHAGLGSMRDVRQVDAAFPQAVHSESSEGIAADLGDEPHAAAQRGKIMRQNRRGTAERDGEAAGQQFALHGHLLGKTVQDQVKIDLPSDCNIEFGHIAGLRHSRFVPTGKR